MQSLTIMLKLGQIIVFVGLVVAVFAQVVGEDVFLRVLLGDGGQFAMVLRFHLFDAREFLILTF